MKSLFILGQPRGFTTPVYHFILAATSLKHSVMSGEVLNVSKDDASYVKMGVLGHYVGAPPEFKYDKEIVCVDDEESFRIASQILDEYRFGFLIKDVVNPYLSLRYINEHPDHFNVLHVYRNPEQCMNHQEARGWPRRNPAPYLDAFFQFPTVRFDDLINDPDVLWDAVENLGYQVDRFNYTDSQSFQDKKKEVLGYE